MAKSRTLIPQMRTVELTLSNAIYVHQAMRKDQINEFTNMAMQLLIRQMFTDTWAVKMREHIQADIDACVKHKLGRVSDQDYTLSEMTFVERSERQLLQSQVNYEGEDEDGVAIEFCGFKRVSSNVNKKMVGQIFKCDGHRFKVVKRGNRLYLNKI